MHRLTSTVFSCLFLLVVNTSFAQASQSFSLTKAVSGAAAAKINEILLTAGIHEDNDDKNLAQLQVKEINCYAPVTRFPIARCTIVGKDGNSEVASEDSQELQRILQNNQAQVVTRQVGSLHTRARNIVCTSNDMSTLCTFDVEVAKGSSLELTPSEMKVIKALFQRAEVPSHSNPPYVFANSSASVRHIRRGCLDTWMLVFAGKMVSLRSNEISAVKALIARVESSRLKNSAGMEEMQLNFSSVMCRPPRWTVSFKG
jgi:hypothetical protein